MKAKRLTYDYDGCHLCGGHMKEKRIKQDFWIKGKLIVIENVPAGVCSPHPSSRSLRGFGRRER